MKRSTQGICLVSSFLLLLVACHPEGCYSPESFGYNTTNTLAPSNLFGLYKFDGRNASKLARDGGKIWLKPDMTVEFSDLPVVNPPEPIKYDSGKGSWKLAKQGVIWEVELYDLNLTTSNGYSIHHFPVVGTSYPYSLEAIISHDEGYWIRFCMTEQFPAAATNR
jgi:hypothetical protein